MTYIPVKVRFNFAYSSETCDFQMAAMDMENDPVLMVRDQIMSHLLQLNIPLILFSRHEAIAIPLAKICSISHDAVQAEERSKISSQSIG